MDLKLLRSLAIIALMTACAGKSFADRNAGIRPTPGKISPELANVMAEMYQRMADCLRSGRSFETCRHEACNCKVISATGHCPIKETIKWTPRRKQVTSSS